MPLGWSQGEKQDGWREQKSEPRPSHPGQAAGQCDLQASKSRQRREACYGRQKEGDLLKEKMQGR